MVGVKSGKVIALHFAGVYLVANPGIIDPNPISQFVTQDAYIRQGIATNAVVSYGDQQIGPFGALPKNANVGM